MSMNNNCRKRWQGYSFSSLNSLFLNLLGLNLSFSLNSKTVFQGVDNFDVSEVPKESTTISVRDVPMVTGTFF